MVSTDFSDHISYISPEWLEALDFLQPIINPEFKSPFLLYLHGYLLFLLNRRSEALLSLFRSVIQLPVLWSAWLIILKIVVNVNELAHLEPLFSHPTFLLFRIHLSLKLHQYDEALDGLELYTRHTHNPLHVRILHPCILSSKGDAKQAQQLFELLFVDHPSELRGRSEFSNTLFVQNDLVKLSELMVSTQLLSPHSSSAFFVLGNFHSLNGDHQKAIDAFWNAIRTEDGSHNASFWTLLGHEYLETRNSAVAIECYRQAIECDSGDYRAFFGLGQTMELLHLKKQAVIHYQAALEKRTNDYRLHLALGSCLESLGKYDTAQQYFMQAKTICTQKLQLSQHDPQSIATSTELHQIIQHISQQMKRCQNKIHG